MNINTSLHDVGYEVVGVVSDMGPTNIGLWKALNITPTVSSFENPRTKKKCMYLLMSLILLNS